MTPTEKQVWIATYAAVYATGQPVERCVFMADRATEDMRNPNLARGEFANSIRNSVYVEKFGSHT